MEQFKSIIQGIGEAPYRGSSTLAAMCECQCCYNKFWFHITPQMARIIKDNLYNT
jgi:hypothetical protein